MPATVISRRAFLRGTVALGAAAVASSLPLAGCRRGDYPPMPHTPAFFTEKEWNVLHAASLRLLPDAPGRLGAGQVDVATAADQLLSKANPHLKADIKQLLNTFEDMPFLSLHFRPFTTMDAKEQDDYLRAWMVSPLGVQRQGFVALNKICAMLFYMDERTWPQIGFPGPWIGKFDFGLGLNNQGPMAAPVNPHVFARYSA